MLVKNLQNGMIQEVTHPDVIGVLRNDARYLLIEEKEKKETAEPAETEPEEMTVAQLRAKARKLGITGASALNRQELLEVLKGV